MNKIKAKFSKKSNATPLTAATKEFLKGSGDQGLSSLPEILEACSSASDSSLASQVEVLDLITRYYAQESHPARQFRCIDLLRYLSDQRDNELFILLSQGHPLIKSIDSTLRNTQGHPSVPKASRLLLDHLVRQPNVSESIVELHAKHVNGINKPHKPTIILTDQEVVADDLKASEAESELLSTLLTDTNVDESLLTEVHDRLVNTKQRLIRDVDTSTNEQQTVNLITAIETAERVLSLYKEMRPEHASSSSRRASIANSNASVGPGYAAPITTTQGRRSIERSRSPARSNGKGKESPPISPETAQFTYDMTTNYPQQDASEDDPFGSSSHQPSITNSERRDLLSDSIPNNDNSAMPATPPKLSSNNPFAKSSPYSPESSAATKPFTKSAKTPSIPANPFVDAAASSPGPSANINHTEGDLDEQWRTLKF